MTTFVQFRDAVEKRFNKLAKAGNLYQSAIVKDDLWDLYLVSFPAGTNPKFRERTTHDCQCCRSYIRNVGRVLGSEKGQVVSIWTDLNVTGEYKVVADALAAANLEAGISGIYLNDDPIVGRKQSQEMMGSGIHTWEHFYQVLPTKAFSKNNDIGARKGKVQTSCKVLKRSITELAPSAVELVSDLISEKAIHRGTEYAPIINSLKNLQKEYNETPNQELYIWDKTVELINKGYDCNIRGTSIGTLLVDLSDLVPLEDAVKKYEDKVSGTNFKRSTSLSTPKMKEEAKQTAKELGIEPSFFRRYANKTDISVNDVLFADNSIKPFMEDSIFDSVKTKSKPAPVPSKLETMTYTEFLENVLPKADSVELFLENQHESNLFSLIAPVNGAAPCIMKWGNNFSWNYNGEVAESVAKQRVKEMGGQTDAAMRLSMIWNSRDDLDFHLYEPNGGHVYYGHKWGLTGSQLDIDMRGERLNQVENIFWNNLGSLKPGVYNVKVHNFSHNGTRHNEDREEGFTVEAVRGGETMTINYPNALRDSSWVDVMQILVDADYNIAFKPLLPANVTTAPKDLWGITTGDFVKVNMVMKSPNMWDNSNKSGNDHLFFILDGCVNPDDSRGFYNEFLIQELAPYRKVFEHLSSDLKAQYSEDQLSGLGFSSTLRREVTLRVRGEVNKNILIKF